MKRMMTFALTAALAASTAANAQTATVAEQPSASIAVKCGAGAAAGSEAPNLHGRWDFIMDVAGTPNFGLLAIGFVGADYGGAISLSMTAPIVLRGITVTGNNFRLVAASPAGDVLFDGVLSAKGDRMCGTVTYHNGSKFAAVAQKQPMTYQSTPQSQRAR